MSELLNSYTFEAKKIVYYSVTVGAENKTEAKRIAQDFEHCKHYKWEGPNRAVVFTSKTASDRRSLQNIKSNIIKQLNHVS